jgi:hypothetical protein
LTASSSGGSFRSDSKFEEIWIEAPDGSAICALINGDVGWLMFLREPGDAGCSSRNPRYAGQPEATIEYRLDNGQHDEYPAAWALPEPEIRRALDHFSRTHEKPPFILWHED